MKVYATADNEFKVYINGILVLTGNNWRQTYTTTVDPKKVRLFECDENHLMVEAKNLHGGSPAALIYQITQE